MLSKRAPAVVDTAVRRTEAVQLRRAGLKLEDIADWLGVNRRTVCNDLDAVLRDLHTIAADQLDTWRSAQLAELQQLRDRAWRALEDEADGRRIAALAGSIVRLEEREARLLGLDAPARAVVQQQSFVPEMTEEEAQRIMAEWEAEVVLRVAESGRSE